VKAVKQSVSTMRRPNILPVVAVVAAVEAALIEPLLRPGAANVVHAGSATTRITRQRGLKPTRLCDTTQT
jgi:hypothetical protein